MDRYFLEPYRFIPPHRGTLWNYLGRPIVSRHIRKNLRVQRWAFSGLEQLREAVKSGAGILLTPNHTRSADPFVLGYMSKDLGHYFYFVASIHLFRASRVRGWLMNRMGAYSIWREGVDRESLRATVNILASAERPVVLFPEGTWFRQNDRVGPLQEGLSLITRQAVRQGKRPILVFPVGIKYWNLTDIQGELRARLSQQEKRLGWKPRSDVPHLERLEKIFEAQIGLNELEYLGQLQSGPTEDRFRMLVESIIQGQEKSHLGQVHEGWHLERIRRLRQHLVRKRQENAGDQDWIARSNRELDTLLFCENIAGMSLEHLRESPTPERFAEIIQRLEETLQDGAENPLGPMGATVQVGAPLDVQEISGNSRHSGEDPLLIRLRPAIQQLIDDLVATGPPPEWNCPHRLLAEPTAHPQSRPSPMVSIANDLNPLGNPHG